jgi:hypothetical protein
MVLAGARVKAEPHGLARVGDWHDTPRRSLTLVPISRLRTIDQLVPFHDSIKV